MTIDGVSFGASCYASNALVSAEYDLTQDPPVTNPQGKARIPADFADGTSHTILHAEKYARCTNTDMAPAFRDGGTAWAYLHVAVFPWQPPPMISRARHFNRDLRSQPWWPVASPNVIGPGSIFQVAAYSVSGQLRSDAGLDSSRRGMMVGLVDGSVRSLSPDLSGDIGGRP